MKLESKILSDYLFDIGCCEICVLRFLRASIDDFLDVQSTFQKVNKLARFQFIAKLKLSITISIQQKFRECNVSFEPAAKRRKPNICVACFNLFDHVDEIVTRIKGDDALKTYEVDNFVTSFSLPVSLSLAQLQIWLALVENYPENFDSGESTMLPCKFLLN